MIPPKQSSEFVAAMEKVLDVYKRPYTPKRPVICMDESPKHLIGETGLPMSKIQGHEWKHDYEYERLGVCNNFLAINEPLAGFGTVQITPQGVRLSGQNSFGMLLTKLSKSGSCYCDHRQPRYSYSWRIL